MEMSKIMVGWFVNLKNKNKMDIYINYDNNQ